MRHDQGAASPDASAAIDIEGRITAVDGAARTPTVTTEDDGLSADFAVIVPDAIDISAPTPWATSSGVRAGQRRRDLHAQEQAR